MTLTTLDVVGEIRQYDSHQMSSEPEGCLYLRYYDESIDDLMNFGDLQLVESLFPTDGREVALDYRVTMTFSESARGTEHDVGETRSRMELRADYMGTRRSKSDSVWFVLRDPNSEDYATRRGMVKIYPDSVPDDASMDFLDSSQEFKLGPLEEVDVDHHRWPGGKPFESYYVTVEFELSPGALDEPPRKNDG